MINVLYNNIEIISALISLFALISSCFALYETKKQHMDSHRAKIIFNIIQQDHTLYLNMQNIGQVPAYDIEVTFNCSINNPVKNLRIIPPSITFRYNLMDSSQVSDYPELQMLQINAKYKDIYCTSEFRMEKTEFPVLELLKYTCRWNEQQNCFDIHRI